MDGDTCEGLGSYAGAVVRDSRGKPLFAAVRMTEDRWMPNVAEAKAVFLGIKAAVEAGFTRVVVESDCLGNVTSFFMFCSLAPTIWRIYLQKDNEEYKFHPIVAGLISCSMWVLYSMPFVHSNPHSILLTPVNNCVGIALYIFYYVVYSYYGDSFSRKSMCIYLYAEVVVLFVLICITLLAFHTHTSWSNFVGIFYVIFGILFYGAPLTVMLKVITTKSVEYMPLSLSIAGLFNGVIWSAYACIKKFDHYILICNAAGAILAVAKLILYTWYYVSAQKESIETLPTPPHHDSRKSSMVILVSYYDKEP